jgi:hypothetical protein
MQVGCRGQRSSLTTRQTKSEKCFSIVVLQVADLSDVWQKLLPLECGFDCGQPTGDTFDESLRHHYGAFRDAPRS